MSAGRQEAPCFATFVNLTLYVGSIRAGGEGSQDLYVTTREKVPLFRRGGLRRPSLASDGS